MVADWQYINDIGDAGGYAGRQQQLLRVQHELGRHRSAEVVDYTIELISTAPLADRRRSFIFSYQVQVDEAGHAYGGGSPEYAEAVTNVSNNIDDIMAAVNAWKPSIPVEDWTVIITTDHGHQQSQGFGHGFQSPNETSSFIIFDLAGDDTNDGKQNLGYSNTDITPTIVSLFGIPRGRTSTACR